MLQGLVSQNMLKNVGEWKGLTGHSCLGHSRPVSLAYCGVREKVREKDAQCHSSTHGRRRLALCNGMVHCLDFRVVPFGEMDRAG